MRVVDQDTGKEIILHSTPALNADLSVFYKGCSHGEKEARRKINRGGGTQYIDQCLTCGRSTGLFYKHSPELENAPSWDDNLEDSFNSLQAKKRAEIIQKHVRLQRNRDTEFWKKYTEYLDSDAWRSIRRAVLDRANGLCEGCRSKEPTQVHHLTYDHVFNEFLFELVAVCDDCHTRLHLGLPEDDEA